MRHLSYVRVASLVAAFVFAGLITFSLRTNEPAVVSGSASTSTSMPTAIAQGTAIPPVTPPSNVTPTAPVTITVHSDWYPTTQPYFAPPKNFASSLAFEPGARDIIFTVNKAYEGGTGALFEAESDGNGDLTSVVNPFTGLEDEVAAIEDVQSSSSASALAVLVRSYGSLGDGTADDV